MGSGEICLSLRGQVSDRGFIFFGVKSFQGVMTLLFLFQNALIEIKVQGL